MWQFIAGAMVGSTIGVALMCLFVVGGKADEYQVYDISSGKDDQKIDKENE